MVPENGNYSLVPQALTRSIPMFDPTPITPELYVCWKFAGLEGKTEEQYRREVSDFVQRHGISATIDEVCRGCVAVIMHGSKWLWWYLTALKSEIEATFGSDLRSITQIGCNNVTELMKRKDNDLFREGLKQLHSAMIRTNIPHKIKNK